VLSLQYIADLICLVTGREPPFGIETKPHTPTIEEVQEAGV
jgi:hypothetical protein